MSCILFSNQSSILTIIDLNSNSGVLLISVSVRALLVTYSCSLLWGEYLYLAFCLGHFFCVFWESLLYFLFLRLMAILRRGPILSRAWCFRKSLRVCTMFCFCCCFPQISCLLSFSLPSVRSVGTFPVYGILTRCALVFLLK